MDILQGNWTWISGNPWGVLTLALACFSFGWGLARLYYQERIEILKEKAGANDQISASEFYAYPPTGRHGKNILANSISDVTVEESISFRAEIPNNSTLHVEMTGPPPTHLADNEPSWAYEMGFINWTPSRYHGDNGGKQTFDAEAGVADMKIQFRRVGEVRLEVFEGTSQVPSWSKIVNVRRPS